jgi:predicted ABC-type ATPase
LGSAEGTVVSARMLRHSVVTRMDFGDFNGEKLMLRVRTPGHFIPEESARFRVALDPQQTFIFPIRHKG